MLLLRGRPTAESTGRWAVVVVGATAAAGDARGRHGNGNRGVVVVGCASKDEGSRRRHDRVPLPSTASTRDASTVAARSIPRLCARRPAPTGASSARARGTVTTGGVAARSSASGCTEAGEAQPADRGNNSGVGGGSGRPHGLAAGFVGRSAGGSGRGSSGTASRRQTMTACGATAGAGRAATSAVASSSASSHHPCVVEGESTARRGYVESAAARSPSSREPRHILPK